MNNNKGGYTFRQIANMYDISLTKNAFYAYEDKGSIPSAERITKGKTQVRAWSIADLPLIGEKLGYLKKPSSTQIVSFFTQKGGTGKTPLAFQFARTLALHNIKVLVIGLDSQETITNILRGSQETDSLPENIDDLYDDGLFEIFKKNVSLEDAIQNTDLKTLQFIPENAGLAALETDLNHSADPLNVMEKFFFSPLKKLNQFDYIICDCNPSWGRIINSVLASSDLLVSPLKCDASTLTTTKTFFGLLADFEKDLEYKGVNIQKFVIPTLLENNKLSRQVLSYYETRFSNICANTPLKKTVTIDEAQILQLSVLEYLPNSPIYKDLISVFKEITDVIAFLNGEDEPSKDTKDSKNKKEELLQA
ncbi:MAG: ParA family protein [Halobacteriovoraceae bacterium]|jgi:chromosome partitioning protein|nr:ParA family protein [Halobacteriovoraceae bacterium]